MRRLLLAAGNVVFAGSSKRIDVVHAGTQSGARSTATGPWPTAGYLERLKAALRKGQLRTAERIVKEYENDSGPNRSSDPSLHNHLLAAYARTRQVEAAFALAEDMRRLHIAPDGWSYSALLNACSKAAHPPYDLPPEHAVKAAEVFQEMEAAGIKPNHVAFHCLMDAQAKAGLLQAAEETFQRMMAAGLRPQTLTLNLLVSACARAGQPGAAQDLMARLQQEHGVAWDSTTWNSLLGAYARAGDVDGAYAAWSRMARADVTPTAVTMRVLAQAFQGNATLANELLQEAAERRQQLLADSQAPEAASQTREAVATARPLRLDLHGLSVSSARAALLQRLELLVDTLDTSAEATANGRGLQVITGAGLHSKAGQGALLREAAAELLQAEGLSPSQEAGNAGRLAVSRASLAQYVGRRRRQREQERLLYFAGWRGVLFAAGVCGAGAATFLVPQLLAATS